MVEYIALSRIACQAGSIPGMNVMEEVQGPIRKRKPVEPNHAFDLFERFRRRKPVITKGPCALEIYFRLDFDGAGAYVSVVDRKGNEINASSESYSGPRRDVLKSIENAQDRNCFRIDWENPNKNIYLAEHDYLIWQLRQCDNVVDQDFTPIRFAEETAAISVSIDARDGVMEARLVLAYQGDLLRGIRLLTENHALAGGTIYRIQPLGENFRDLHLFESAILPVDLERYLSLLYSHFDTIRVKYEDYREVEGSPRHTRPALLFEKVDADGSLYLKIVQVLPGFNPGFLHDFDIAKVATLNSLEKTVVTSIVLREDITSHFNEIEKLLKRHKRRIDKGKEYHVEDNFIIIEEGLAREFIYHELPHLLIRYSLFGAEKLKSYKVRAVTPRLNISLSHGVDFLEGDAFLDIEGQSIALSDALHRYRKNAYIPLNDGTYAVINRRYMEKLARIFKRREDKVRVSFFDLPVVEELIDDNAARKAFPRSREIFAGFNTLKDAEAEYPALNTDLRPYQKHGYKWIRYLHRHSLGGCLADDMGLGKTVQAIAMLASVYPGEKKSSLIVMPRTLLFNWACEIEKFRPGLTYYTYHGPARDIKEARQRHLILTTYATVRNDIETLKEEEFLYVILDESQGIKNMQSQVSQAAMMLRSQHRLALSGTPIENNLGELYALFRFLNPAMFGSIEDFNAHYAGPIMRDNDKEVMQELRKKIYPFILRRTKRDVLTELPEKIEQTLFVDMSPKQRLFYEQRREFYYKAVREQIAETGIRRSQFFILQALSELRQIASIPESKSDGAVISPKREALREQIADVIAGGHKVLVFANFLAALDCIAEDLERSGVEYLMMTGATRDRETLVRRFQSDENSKVFLMTLKTGGLGLNLTAADYIFLFDPWWNRAAENQAIDRTHRIGQDKTVFSYRLITRETIEEKILQLQQLKSELFEALISADGASIKSLSEEDVEFILGG